MVFCNIILQKRTNTHRYGMYLRVTDFDFDVFLVFGYSRRVVHTLVFVEVFVIVIVSIDRETSWRSYQMLLFVLNLIFSLQYDILTINQAAERTNQGCWGFDIHIFPKQNKNDIGNVSLSALGITEKVLKPKTTLRLIDRFNTLVLASKSFG